MTEEEFEKEYESIKHEGGLLLNTVRTSDLFARMLSLICSLKKERDIYRHLLERETKEFAEFRRGL